MTWRLTKSGKLAHWLDESAPGNLAHCGAIVSERDGSPEKYKVCKRCNYESTAPRCKCGMIMSRDSTKCVLCAAQTKH